MEFNNVIGVAELLSIIGGVWVIARKISTLETVITFYVVPELRALKGQDDNPCQQTSKDIVRQAKKNSAAAQVRAAHS